MRSHTAVLGAEASAYLLGADKIQSTIAGYEEVSLHIRWANY